MEQTPLVIEPEPAPQPPTTSLVARLFNVFAEPSEVFAELKTATVSTANWLVPALLAIAVSWSAAVLIFSQDSIQHQLSELTDQAIQKQIDKQHMSEQQAEQMRAAAAKFGGISQKVGAVALPVVAAFASPFIWGFFLWLVGAKILKGSFHYMKAVEAVGLGNMIGVLDAIVKSLLILVMGNIFVSPSLVLLVKDFNPQNPMHTLLGLVNVMSFWLLAVRSIGLARLSGASFAKAAAWVFGIWAVYSLAFWGFGAAMQAVFSRATG